MFSAKCSTRRLKLSHQIIVGLLLLFLCSTTTSIAQTNVTFEDVSVLKRDGWTHQHVSVVLDSSGEFILMERADGSVRNLPVTDIFQIVDSQGTDVTVEVVPGFLPMPRRAPRSSGQNKGSSYDEFGIGEAQEAEEGNWFYKEMEPPQLFNIMFVGGMGYSTQVGSFYSELQSALSYSGEIALSVSPRKYIKFAFRNTRAAEETYSYYSYENDSMLEVHSTLDIRQYTITVGTLSRPNSHNSIRYYTELGLGVADHVYKNDRYYDHNFNDSLTRLMIVFNGGVLFPINEHLGVDLGVSSAIKMFSVQDNEGIGFLFDVRAGLTLKFGEE